MDSGMEFNLNITKIQSITMLVLVNLLHVRNI